MEKIKEFYTNHKDMIQGFAVGLVVGVIAAIAYIKKFKKGRI